MKPLSEATAKIASKSFERKYIALGRIVKNWEEIVGAKLADKAQPVKIQYRYKSKNKNSKNKGEKPTATLEIATSSSHATALHYQKDLILERINQIFGERWVTAIKFVNVPSNTIQKPKSKTKPPLTTEEKKALSELTFSVEDEQMRKRLETLGTAIFTDQKS